MIDPLTDPVAYFNGYIGMWCVLLLGIGLGWGIGAMSGAKGGWGAVGPALFFIACAVALRFMPMEWFIVLPDPSLP